MEMHCKEDLPVRMPVRSVLTPTTTVPTARRMKQMRVVQTSNREELGLNLAFKYGVARAREIEMASATPMRVASS
jgi:hypothetical protein